MDYLPVDFNLPNKTWEDIFLSIKDNTGEFDDLIVWKHEGLDDSWDEVVTTKFVLQVEDKFIQISGKYDSWMNDDLGGYVVCMDFVKPVYTTVWEKI